MRVIAGTHRGRPLAAPAGHTTRPITDRVKETLFNILGHRCGHPGGLPAVAVLDVFSGPGSLGIEALSRGARRCTFVERDRRALMCLRANLKALGLMDASMVVTDNAWTMRPPLITGGYQLLFFDPPYRDACDPVRVGDLLERFRPAAGAGATLVLRHERAAPAVTDEQLCNLRVDEVREYGRMRLVFIRCADDRPFTSEPPASTAP